MSSQEKSYLNDFHKQASEAGLREVKEMSKRPLSLSEVQEQVRKIKEQLMKESHKRMR